MAEIIDRLSAQVISSVSDYSRLDTVPDNAVLGVITATKGPVNELVLCQTTSALVSTFGEPTPEHKSLVGAHKIISSGNAMWLVRVANSASLSDASATIAGTRNVINVSKTSVVPSGSSATVGKIADASVPTWVIGEDSTSVTVTKSGSSFIASLTIDGEIHELSDVKVSGTDVLLSEIGVKVSDVDDSLQEIVISIATGSDTETANLKIHGVTKGSSENGISVSVSSVAGGKFNILLKRGDLKVEEHTVSLNPEDNDFILTLPSDRFVVEAVVDGVVPTTITDAQELTLAGGRDGVNGLTPEDCLGEVDPETGTATGAKLFLQPRVTARFFPSLGFTDKKFLVGMAEISKEKKFITCLFDTPNGMRLSQACKWVNNEGEEYKDDLVLEGWMCEVYWPWVTDSYNGYPMEMPPSVYVCINSMDSMKRVGLQLPVAGNPRGVLNGVGVVTQIPSVVDRDKLVTNRINPIWDTGVAGVQIFGNETLNNDYTDLRSAHIGRMLADIVTRINDFTQTLEFELNDSMTWQRWIDGATQILQEYKDKRGLNWFGLKMGLDTTSAKEIALRQIRGQIGLQFVQDAEVFWLNYAVFASSASEIDF